MLQTKGFVDAPFRRPLLARKSSLGLGRSSEGDAALLPISANAAPFGDYAPRSEQLALEGEGLVALPVLRLLDTIQDYSNHATPRVMRAMVDLATL